MSRGDAGRASMAADDGSCVQGPNCRNRVPHESAATRRDVLRLHSTCRFIPSKVAPMVLAVCIARAHIKLARGFPGRAGPQKRGNRIEPVRMIFETTNGLGRT